VQYFDLLCHQPICSIFSTQYKHLSTLLFIFYMHNEMYSYIIRECYFKNAQYRQCKSQPPCILFQSWANLLHLPSVLCFQVNLITATICATWIIKTTSTRTLAIHNSSVDETELNNFYINYTEVKVHKDIISLQWSQGKDWGEHMWNVATSDYKIKFMLEF